MGLLGIRYGGMFDGRRVELILDNLSKTVALQIDGTVLATEDRRVPHDITLATTFEHAGATHKIVARSRVNGLATTDSIEIDGKPFSITRKWTPATPVAPRGWVIAPRSTAACERHQPKCVILPAGRAASCVLECSTRHPRDAGERWHRRCTCRSACPS